MSSQPPHDRFGATMIGTVLWLAILMTVGSLLALASRRLGVPSATGALAGGFAAAAAARGAGLDVLSDHSVILSLLVAYVSFLLGTELDLRRLVDSSRSMLGTLLAQMLIVIPLVFGVGLALGMDPVSSLVLGSAAAAASPTSLIAVTAETRARGDRTQRLLALAPLSLVSALLAFSATLSSIGPALSLLAAILIGGFCGLVILMPLSRMVSRGAIIACLAGGAVLLSLTSAIVVPHPAVLVTASALAGFLSGNLTPNREEIHGALRDSSLPCFISLFVLLGSMAVRWDLPAVWLGAVLVVLARGAGLMLAGLAARRSTEGLIEGLALLPMGGLLASVSLRSTPTPPWIIDTLLTAGLLSQATGMILTRWALLRSGEAVSPAEDPEAWRASMR